MLVVSFVRCLLAVAIANAERDHLQPLSASRLAQRSAKGSSARNRCTVMVGRRTPFQHVNKHSHFPIPTFYVFSIFFPFHPFLSAEEHRKRFPKRRFPHWTASSQNKQDCCIACRTVQLSMAPLPVATCCPIRQGMLSEHAFIALINLICINQLLKAHTCPSAVFH